MADEEYSFVTSGKLKLKDKEAKRKRKLSGSDAPQSEASVTKTSKAAKDVRYSVPSKSDSVPSQSTSAHASASSRKTKAELAFEETRRKRLLQELAKKPPKSHKERVLELNQHLDSLTEHFDIPKVSWTK